MSSPAYDHIGAAASSGRPLGASITQRLRLETRGEHEAIEKNPRMGRLTADDLQMSEYLALLIRLVGFHRPLERGLARWTDRFGRAIDLPSRLVKTDLLRRDIAALAPDLDADAGADAPFGAFATLEQAWGCLYVVEGSTLGGQLISRRLAATLGVTPDRGAAFHYPYGARTGARWQAFKLALEEGASAGALDEDAIIAGARATFHAMDAWMAAGQ